MRSLTDAEARVISVLLAAAPGQEKDRLRQLELPRSTYHAARRRAYEEGWLRDRYIPDPGRFGFGRVTFVLARPFADRAAELVEKWDRAPGNVLAWGSAQLTLGVFYHPSEAASAKLLRSVAPPLVSWSFTLDARADAPSIPVYFDFEGLWVHLGGFAGALGYPHGLGGTPVVTGNGGAATSGLPRREWAAQELVRRPFVAQEQGRAGHLVGPFGLPWSQQKLVRTGAVRHRVLLDPSRTPPYRGRSIEQVTFITGELIEEVRPEALFASLTRECRVFPFLYVAEERKLLIGALGRGAGGASSEAAPEEPRRSVMATLSAALRGIELVQDLVTRVRVVADHRYDRLFPATPAA
ncbi:MAG: hypothetical protein ACREDK_04065 [Thermoplasmata archaeon]